MELTKLLAVRNSMEAYILEMRSAKRRKHGTFFCALLSLLSHYYTRANICTCVHVSVAHLYVHAFL